ncbi:hypothetical protein VZT92_016422 [Zoarces viviparus]|uniref:Uncharacterized protein n=1 Tax=Zoarces viviparus TaxID=48416 RepID=A0AAW1ET12_ZOAVI
MGNLALFTGLCRSDATVSEQVNKARFITNRISEGITYYYTPFLEAEEQTLFAAEDSQTSTALCPNSSPSPSALPVSDSSQNQSDSSSTSRPLLLFFSWLGARPAAVGKYRDLYLDRGMDVLLVQSKVTHFLWPRWGLDYGMEVLKVLEQPRFSERAVLVHATSIGGFTFTQTLINVAGGRKQHAGLDQRVIGHIYDSLVFGTLEHMAIGLGKTLVPRLENFVKNAAMLYFWLFKKHTADIYDSGIQAFYDNPITAPALFYSSENDAMCDTAGMEKLIDHWRMRGVTVESRKWKVSKHAAHMRCHPEDYLSTLEKYLQSLVISSSRANVRGLNA